MNEEIVEEDVERRGDQKDYSRGVHDTCRVSQRQLEMLSRRLNLKESAPSSRPARQRSRQLTLTLQELLHALKRDVAGRAD